MRPVLTAPEDSRASAADGEILDPLRYRVALPLACELYPLGFPVRLGTNSPDVIAAAASVWASYPRRFDVEPVEIRLAVAMESQAGRPPATLPSGQANLISCIHSSDNFMIADVSRGFAYGWLTPSVATDHGYLRYHFLEPTVYLALDCLYLAPIHAACVSLNGSGLLLCGDSGAGKTSLAYQLARRGWTYVSDDAAHLVRTGGRRVIGKPYQIRFRHSACDLFPELRDYTPVLRNGKLDLEIPTGSFLPSISTEADADYLVRLNRTQNGQAELAPWNRHDAELWLHRVLCFGEEKTRQDQKHALRRLLDRTPYILSYSSFAGADLELRKLIDSKV